MSIKNYISKYASSIQALAILLYDAYAEMLIMYEGSFGMLDEDPYALLREDTIDEVVNAFLLSGEWLDTEVEFVQDVYRKTMGICSVTVPSSDAIFAIAKPFPVSGRLQ